MVSDRKGKDAVPAQGKWHRKNGVRQTMPRFWRKGKTLDEDVLGLNVLSHPGSGSCRLSGDEPLGLEGDTGGTAEGPC